MADDDGIRAALARMVRRLSGRPDETRRTVTGNAVVEDGLRAVFQMGQWTLPMDMPAALGGGGTAPTPGVYGRAAIAGCLAITLKLEAARMGVPVGTIDVTVETEVDDRGDFGLDGVPPGIERWRLDVTIGGAASQELRQQLLDNALAVSSWIDAAMRAQDMRIELRRPERIDPAA